MSSVPKDARIETLLSEKERGQKTFFQGTFGKEVTGQRIEAGC